MEKDFFQSQTRSSEIKAKIVAEYFPQYCKIILKRPQTEIRYLDLFAGPGLYGDGSHSTPLLIAKACADDPVLRSKVRLLFNDKEYASELKTNFLALYPAGTFDYEPRFGDKIVGEDTKIQWYLTKDKKNPNPSPTLLFFDPWGYKGIDTLALSKFLENWGNEIFLFVNIKRIHAAIENDKFDNLMLSLFPTTIDSLKRDRRYKATVYERLNLIMDKLASEFKNAVGTNLYHCAFKFQEEDSNTTSHFIIHFTKHAKGFELVKQIYYDFDNIGATLERDGVYSFDAKKMGHSTLEFADTNVEALSQDLGSAYKGRTIKALELYEQHHPKTKYCGSHYAKTLRRMVELGNVEATFTDEKAHKVTVLLTEHCTLKFK